ncbi:endonuclease domain-containing protein [Streptomyces bullii]|uniref:Endonuclease domain-containing protein n=1 Tax=Streptomyces bullii TaxID=349910 RepID=A0ABW0UWU8_9ACTN
MDHSRNGGRVRGVLCCNCNFGVGLLRGGP